MDKDKYDEQLQWRQNNTRKREKNWGNNVDIDIDDEIDYDENFGGNDYDERIDDHDDDYDNDPEKSDKSWKFHGRKSEKKENERYGDNGYVRDALGDIFLVIIVITSCNQTQAAAPLYNS